MGTYSVSPSDEEWQAITTCNSSYDGRFYYAVTTTNIFCRPSCKSKQPRRDNVVIFQHASEALAEQFRPCKRCKPDGLTLPAEDWVQMIAEWMETHYEEQITLQRLAELAHGSPFHLQRQFKAMKGISPAQYLQQIRLEAAKQDLLDSARSAADIGRSVGFASEPYFNSLFKKMVGDTPAAYRTKHIQLKGSTGREQNDNHSERN